MLKLKHLRHPIRSLSTAWSLIAMQWNVIRLVYRGERRYRNDPRYDPQNVTDGFAPRAHGEKDDTALLQRICKAYIAASEQQALAKPAYQATRWWQAVRQESLRPVQKALAGSDYAALQTMYRNFFRDPCSAGLIGVPFHISQAHAVEHLRDLYRRFYLSDALHRIDYWTAQTAGRFALPELTGPGLGNPFGLSIAETFVSTGAEYQHFYAHKICGLLASNCATVVEIGGGFGGLAYFLLRERPSFRYLDFDVPESLALTSYYLLKSFPNLRFLLYGEEELTRTSFEKFDVILMPVFELGKVPAKSVDLAFSSHAITSLAPQAMQEYLNEVARFTRELFLYVGNGPESLPIEKLIRAEFPALTLQQKRVLDWNRQRYLNSNEAECLYRFGAGS